MVTGMPDRPDPGQGGHASKIQTALLLVWVISLVVAAQLYMRSQALAWTILAALVCAASLVAWLWRLQRTNQATRNATERAFGRFILRQTLLILAYVLGLVLALHWLDHTAHTGWRIALVAVPALALAGWAWVFAAMIQSSDEMMRALRIRAIALAAGAVLVLATIWGLFAELLGLPEFPAYLLLPGFALVYGVALQILGGAEA